MEQFRYPIVDWLFLHCGCNRQERETIIPASTEQELLLDYIYPNVSKLLSLQKVASPFVGQYVRSFNVSQTPSIV